MIWRFNIPDTVLKNKAVYTTALVAYGWAGAVMQVNSPFAVFSHCGTDGPNQISTPLSYYFQVTATSSTVPC